MSLWERARDLKLLSLSREHQRNFNRDYRLQKKGLYEQSEEIFEPLIVKQNELLKQQEKQIEAIKALEPKAIEGSKPNLPIEIKTNNLGTEKLPKTWRLTQNANGNFFLNDHLLVIEDDNIRLANSNTSYPFTYNLRALLNGADISSVNDREDLINYSNLTIEANSSKSSKRSEKLMQKINSLYKGEALKVITISENPKELWDRLKILIAASKEGHSNTLNEKTAILDKLLQLGEITKEHYKSILKGDLRSIL